MKRTTTTTAATWRKKFGTVQFNKPEWLCVFGFPLSPSVLLLLFLCVFFAVVVAFILALSFTLHAYWMSMCSKQINGSQHVWNGRSTFKSRQKGFFYFMVFFFLSFRFVSFRFCCFCSCSKKKLWAYDRFPNFSLHSLCFSRWFHRIIL